MKIDQIDDPIAHRKLAAEPGPVLVTIGRPKLFEEGHDYYCPYCIEHRDSKRFSYAGGMDEVQAIQLVFKKINADLVHLGNKINSTIAWLDDTPGETGFE